MRVSIEGVKRQDFYMRRADLPALEAAAYAPKGKQGAAIIAPLDNLMWDRNLVRKIFDFDYVWEVYVPAAKRRYGYYVMPVLYGDRLVARIDPEFDRAGKVFRVKNWWWEQGVNKKDEAMLSAVEKCLADFARYLNAAGIEARTLKGEPGLVKAVKRANQA